MKKCLPLLITLSCSGPATEVDLIEYDADYDRPDIFHYKPCPTDQNELQEDFDTLEQKCRWSLVGGQPYVSRGELILEGPALLETKDRYCSGDFLMYVTLEKQSSDSLRLDLQPDRLTISTSPEYQNGFVFACEGNVQYRDVQGTEMIIDKKGANFYLSLDEQNMYPLTCPKPAEPMKITLGTLTGVPQAFKVDDLSLECLE